MLKHVFGQVGFNIKKIMTISIVRLFPISLIFWLGCATLPETQHQTYKFPEQKVFVEKPSGENEARKFKTLGWVRSKAVFSTLNSSRDHAPDLCKNYYNKAAQDLWREAKKVKADAVIQVRSVVLLMDGKVEEHKTPECSDDGAEGEVLLKGIAVQFLEETQ